MDYCSTCRRHLNGALVCPGCGAYAPDIAPVRVERGITAAPIARSASMPTASMPTPPASTARTLPPAGVVAQSPAPAYSGIAPVAAPAADVEDVPSGSAAPYAPPGRAARRRQLARWKKNQRRAVVATAVALVGGGLTFAALDRQTGDQAQAATTPELPPTAGGKDPASERTRPTVSRSDGHRTAPSAGRTADTRTDSLPSAPATPVVPRQRSGPASHEAAGTTGTGGSGGAGTSYASGTTGATGASGATGSAGQQPAGSAAGDGTGSSTSDASGTSGTSGTSSSSSGSSSGSTGSSSTGAPSSSTGTAPAGTSPSDVCLLGLICLG
ncbi:SCO2400 family protein [Streptomyces asoensis]|uniref:SCO2400 family protein n=1 Tax=Streptomyces asoensis TaxID=249586 RepID=UPI003408B64E